MAEQNTAAPERSGKPPAITVRLETWDDYDWVTKAAERRGNSRGEFLALSALQRRSGGAMPQSMRALRERRANVRDSATVKADVAPRPKSARPPGRAA